VLGLFFFPIPLFMKQCYLVWVGVVTAFIFTYIPEWTAWVLLVLMAVYDLIAVLVPGGPLKVRRCCCSGLTCPMCSDTTCERLVRTGRTQHTHQHM
jgi:hypothetical protein